jgi:hypothetical protein
MPCNYDDVWLTKDCPQCSGRYDAEAFFHRSTTRSATRRLCIGCFQSNSDTKKHADRWRVKIRDTTNRHGRRLGIPVDVLKARYGWHAEEMQHDAEHAWENGCPYCRKPFKSMPRGLGELTVDIVDPKLPPHYTTNTKYVCNTCNKQKQRTPPELWARKLIAWRQWEQQRLTGPRQRCLF